MLPASCAAAAAAAAEDHEEGSLLSIVDEQQQQQQDEVKRCSGEKEFLCPVCFQTLKDPFLTACGHSFCYACIQTHLSKKSDCPSCLQPLSSLLIYPNILLDKVLRRLSALQALERASCSPAEHLQLFFQNGEELPLTEIDAMLELLTDNKIKVKNREDEKNMELLFQCLQHWNEEKRKNLAQVRGDLKALERDVIALREQRRKLSSLKRFYLSKFSAKVPAVDMTSRKHPSAATRKRQSLDREYEAVQACYLRHCRRFRGEDSGADSHHPTGLDDFRSVLRGFTRYSQVRVLGETRTGRPYSPNIISSIEFDKDDEFFATAGVSGSLKIFNYSVVGSNCWEAAVDIQTRSKLSCISWNDYARSLVGSSDYDGIIKIWDICSSQCVAEFEEHEGRAWSVDFSPQEPSMLISGSDDGKVKVWCKGQRSSVSTIEVKANICSVKHNPSSNNLIAAGSADHCIYYYDLRHTVSPVEVFSEHQKAVSYIKFMSSNEMVSASTDGTLRLWNLDTKSTNISGSYKCEEFCGTSSEQRLYCLWKRVE